MPTNIPESTRGGREPVKEPEEGAPNAGKTTEPKASGGFKPWLPLVVALLTMPALAYATTMFVLLPKIQRALVPSAAGSSPASDTSASPGAEAGGAATPAKTKVNVALSKMLVNVAGTMGTRYLMTSVTLVGNNADFKNKIDENKDQLMDLATGALSSKTISDLEKPGVRNVIRAELMTLFNNALGGPAVQDIYITELAIQ
ncbi:MAG TPA: flagellar basal body-associated FliL family protein [Candidatus Baltobacteraceae bacterium]|jgi:flagellar FliL protein|nr:flagellar basal body-associated FliL family protein [Candidatus Baltobacteraceae bacterium]